VRNRKVAVLAATLLILMAEGLVPTGCSDAKGRDAARKLLDEVDVASRLYGKAVSLMSQPPARLGGQYLPLEKVTRAPQATVELPMPMAVNPDALKSLEEAEAALAAALRQYGRDAGPEQEALANTVWGDVLMLKADFQLAASAGERQQSRDTLTAAIRATSMVQLYGGLVRYYERLTSLSDRDVQAMLSAAQKDASDLQAEIAAVQQEISDLEGQINTLKAANDQMLPQVRELRLNAAQRSGQDGLDLLEKSLRLEGEINQNNSSIAERENTLEQRRSTLADRTMALEDAQGRQKAAEAMTEVRKGYAERGSSVMEEMSTSLAKAKADAQDRTVQLSRLCEKLSESEALAGEAYELALEKFNTARRLRPQTKDASAVARIADAQWAIAELQSHALNLRGRVMQLVEQLAWAWSPGQSPTTQPQTTREAPTGAALIEPVPDIRQAMPAFARGLLAYVPDPEQVRTKAIDAYQQAADLYTEAARLVSPQLRWAYQGQAGAAYVALYDLTGGQEALDKARETLGAALENKRESTYLQPVVALEQMLPAAQPREPSAPGAPEAAPAD